MFGSLRIENSQLDAGGRARYRAAFCAGCHALHDLCGRPAALLTNYDQTVLALVLAGLGGSRPAERRACTALPFRSVAVQPLDEPSAALLAALDVGAVRAKLADDVDDGDRPLVKRAVLRLLRGPGERALAALRRLGFPVSLFDELPAVQRAVERSAAPTIEALGAPSAELTAQVFAHAGRVAGREDLAPALAAFGHGLGTWIYGYDAWRDLAADLRLGRFNAWVACGRTAARDVADHLAAALRAAGAARAALPLGADGEVLDALLASLGRRVAAVRASASPVRAGDRREAGDCDCACDCGQVGCCGDASCCGDAGCCGDAAGAGTGASTDAACNGVVCCCDPLCCWSTPGAGERRTVRRAQRARRRGADLAEVDLSPLVGSKGEAVTDLLPRGRVRVRGLEFDAEAASGILDAGAHVVVEAVERGRLVVTRDRRG